MPFYGRLISSSPFVMIAGTGNGMLGPAWPMIDFLPEKCYILISFWTHFGAHTASNLRYELLDYQRLHPHRRFLFLANELSQLEELRRLGLASVMGNHNLFLDEDIFKPSITERSKRFDAIYNARMNPEKHHNLCSGLRSVGLLYYFNPPGDFRWFNDVRKQLPTATFINGDPLSNSYRHFTPSQCADLYNDAHVGLCLSGSEGAMLASMEYLMCGIPVVTTPNVGGRNHLFRSEYAIMANPTPESIAECVDILISRKLNPDYVRNTVLEIVRYERDRFIEDVQTWLRSEGAEIDFGTAFRARWINRMWETFESVNDFSEKNKTILTT